MSLRSVTVTVQIALQYSVTDKGYAALGGKCLVMHSFIIHNSSAVSAQDGMLIIIAVNSLLK